MKQILNNKVQARSLVDEVTERLEEAIISGELAPGSKLSEQALADSLGVSRGPLREAIRRLEGRKLVQRTPNIGVRIASLTAKDLDELLILREALEGMACRLAADRITDDEIGVLSELLSDHAQRQSVLSGAGYYQDSKDFDFHFRIARASGNERLISMICGDLYDLLRVYRYKSSTLRGRAISALKEHRAVLAALRKRDPDAAEAKMREHLRNARLHVCAEMMKTLGGGEEASS